MDTRAGTVPVRGEATRGALILAAVQVFGRDGYSAATTKAIARQAGANQALISYYFGGKEGLYTAVVEHITEEIGRRIGPVAEQVESERRRVEASTAMPAAEARMAYFDLLRRVLDGFIDVLTAVESAAWAKIIVREQQEPSAAFEILYQGVQGRLLDQIGGLVARIEGRRVASAADRLTVLTIVGQVLVFRVARAAALRYMGWEGLRPRDVARIKRALARNLAAMLNVAAE